MQLVSQTDSTHITSNQLTEYGQLNPAFAYLHSLDSKLSQQTMYSNLKQIVRILYRVPKENSVDMNTISAVDWSKFDKNEFKALIDRLKESSYSLETINTFIACVRGIMGEAFDSGLISAEQLTRIKRVKRPKGSRIAKGRMINRQERDVLLESCDDSPSGVRDKAIISMLFSCGLRRSELANIEMKHIDNDIIRIIGKGNKEREAFLTEKTKMHLNEWIEEVRGSEPGALFVRIYQDGSLASLFKESGEPNCLSSQAIYFILKKKSEQLEMQAFTPHDFRRTLASTMLENGEDLSTVKDTLGHASISTTQRYDKRAKSRIKSAVERTGF